VSLKTLRKKLKPSGHLIIQVPHYLENAFVLLVADHATHFTPESLRRIVELAGFTVIEEASNWIPKELTLIATNDAPETISPPIDSEDITIKTNDLVEWLHTIVRHATNAATNTKSFGLFGTSIAATWMASELEGHISFFVDEDPARIGKTYLGCPIYSPDQVPEGSTVYVGVAPHLSQVIAERLSTDTTQFLPLLPFTA
jgi:hypothetical protein